MSAEPTAPQRTFAQRILGENPTAWAFVLPAVVIIVGLAIVPIVWSLLLSFNSADLIAPAEWVGLSNYDALLEDPGFATQSSTPSSTRSYSCRSRPGSVCSWRWRSTAASS